MRYTLTFTTDAAVIKRLQQKRGYPMLLGGVEWVSGHSITTDDLRPFIDPYHMRGDPNLTNERIVELGLVDARIAVELTPAEATNGELPETEI